LHLFNVDCPSQDRGFEAGRFDAESFVRQGKKDWSLADCLHRTLMTRESKEPVCKWLESLPIQGGFGFSHHMGCVHVSMGPTGADFSSSDVSTLSVLGVMARKLTGKGHPR
jgi:hypothetical protein